MGVADKMNGVASVSRLEPSVSEATNIIVALDCSKLAGTSKAKMRW